MNIKFNDKRALKVFQILENCWQERQGVFENIVLPRNRWELPEDPLRKSLFLFCAVIFMRGGVISEPTLRLLLALERYRPRHFEPEFASKSKMPEDPATLLRTLRETEENLQLGRFGYQVTTHLKSWVHNLSVLAQRWEGDPRNIFKGVKDFEEAFSRIKKQGENPGLKGMKQKVFCLLTVWLQAKGLIPMFPCPFPVDFHALRVLWQTEIIQPQGVGNVSISDETAMYFNHQEAGPKLRLGDKVIGTISEWAKEFLSKHSINHIHINSATWVLSRELCVNHFQASSRDDRMFLVNPAHLKRSPACWPKNYKNPCMFCPIEEYCTGIVPSAPNYRINRGLIRLERIPYRSPHMFLPGICWTEHLPIPARNRTRK